MKNLTFNVLIVFSSIFVGAYTSNRTERLINRNVGFKSKRTNKTENSFDKNYLNYRDVYGIRYSPIVKKAHIDNHIDDKYTSNGSKTKEEHLLTSFESETTSNFVSSETLSNSIESSTVQGINFTLDNFVDDEYEPEIEGTSSHHIMKPNNRYEHALNFLANRMKSLLYYSNDHTRPESQMVSPHLVSLGKVLNLFSLIRLDNGPCLAGHKPMRQLSGSCMNEAECLNFGGISMNRCANGLGACCIFKSSCGTVTHQNVTYFESPNYPFAAPANFGSCTLTLLLSRDVKQVLLEFQFFELLPPKDGDCIDDQFIISTEWGSLSHEIPILCGTATGQHLYIAVEGFEKLFLSILTHTVEERAFNIKITQLRSHDRLAPAGCLQYFTQKDGLIKSFNYDDDYSKFPYRNPSYFNNMNYAICIKREIGYCRVYFTNEIQGREDIFELVNTDANDNILSDNQAGAEIFSCPQDFIAVNYIRLCGSKLNDGSLSTNFNQNAPVRSYMNGPIIIPVKSDNQTVGRGFKLYYFQEKCLELTLSNSSKINFAGDISEPEQDESSIKLKSLYKAKNPKFDQIRNKIVNSFKPCNRSMSYSQLWSEVDSWSSETANEIYPLYAKFMCQLLTGMKQVPLISSRNSKRGTQFKMNFTVEGNKSLIFKPSWYPRNEVIEGEVYSGKDRHNSEILAFYLGALMNLRWTSIVVGRSINLRDVFDIADKELQETIISKRNGTKLCVYGKCYYCNPSETVCGNKTHYIEGVFLYEIPGLINKHKSPWQRTYKEGQKAIWEFESDDNYCDNVKQKLTLVRLLDLIDAAIFDFLIQNGDRHHYETRKNRLLLLDNGKGFGNPYVDFTDILAPLYQCCLIRKTTYARLLVFTGGSLTEILKQLTKFDNLYPIINDLHFNAIERRLLKLFSMIEFCRSKFGNGIFQ